MGWADARRQAACHSSNRMLDVRAWTHEAHGPLSQRRQAMNGLFSMQGRLN
jgi:hypothetical protein